MEKIYVTVKWWNSGQDDELINQYIYNMIRLLILAVYCCHFVTCLPAQTISPATWLQQVQASGPQQCSSREAALDYFRSAGIDEKKKLVSAIQQSGGTSTRSKIISRMLFAVMAPLAAVPTTCEERTSSQMELLNLVLQEGDKFLLADFLQKLGNSFHDCKQYDKALLYRLKSYELKQELGYHYFTKQQEDLQGLGAAFFDTREYDSCIVFTKRSIATPGTAPAFSKKMSAYNIVAISYQRLRQFDSAQAWFDRAYAIAVAEKNNIWPSIIRGNIGYLKMEQGKLAEALPLLREDFQSSVLNNDTASAGNTLQRIARIYFQQGKKDSALQLARTAFAFATNTRKYSNLSYQINACETLADILEGTNNFPEAQRYYKRFVQLRDSSKAMIAASRLDGIQLRINYEKKASEVQSLYAANRSERQKQQLLVAALLLLLVCGTLFILWSRQKNKLKQQELVQEKLLAEATVQAATRELENFRIHIVEKNELIEQLESRLQHQDDQTRDALLQQTILTDADWLRFREMFEKVHPGFFRKLQLIAPDITAAETRMASVIRLGLGNKHIASMLGVSGDTVRKAKFRLRQRLQLAEENSLEDFIQSLS